MFKKIFIGGMCVVGLAGCEVGVRSDAYIQAESHLTTKEEVLLEYYYSTYSHKGYDMVLKELTKLRELKPYYNLDTPFCDVVESVTFLDSDINRKSSRSRYSISAQWKERTGKSLPVSCGAEGGLTIVTQASVTQPEVTSQVIDATVTLDNETLLSPLKVRELTTTAKDCLRAKTKLLELTEGGRYLTIGDYESVTKLILDCDNLKLQVELNK